jgi:hypothetical protein
MEGDQWLNRHSSGSDESDDPYSSAALSRRAEIILANAKKRLNVCRSAIRTPWNDADKSRSWRATFEAHASR